ncbi:MAG: hypothetical protein WCI74_15900, partial [Actinomycetes bacterium]
FLLIPKDKDGKPVWVDRDHPAAHEVRLTDFTGAVGDVDEVDPFADNLLFTGDSLGRGGRAMSQRQGRLPRRGGVGRAAKCSHCGMSWFLGPSDVLLTM